MRILFIIILFSNLYSCHSLGFLFQRQQKMIKPVIKYPLYRNTTYEYNEPNNTFYQNMFMILHAFIM